MVIFHAYQPDQVQKKQKAVAKIDYDVMPIWKVERFSMHFHIENLSLKMAHVGLYHTSNQSANNQKCNSFFDT